MTGRAGSQLSKIWQGIADRQAAEIRDAFLVSQNVGTSSRSILGYVLAVLVILLALVMGGLGLWFALRTLGLVGHLNGIERVVSGFCAVILLGIVWMARPRFDLSWGRPITAQEAPEFYALINEVAQQLRVQMPRRVTLLLSVNAFMGRSGFPPQPALGYGLPLWFAMHPQERVAILAHELAHERNNDPTRGGLVGLALNILAQLMYVLRPEGQVSGDIIDLFTKMLQWLFSRIPLVLYGGLLQLVGADQQRAEYRADLLAAEVAGTEATSAALDKLHLAGLYESALHKHRHQPERPHVFLELRHMWDTMSQDDRQKRRDEYGQMRLRLDDSHPPTVDRVRVVQAYHYEPKVILTEERAARIDAELAPFIGPLADEAYDLYREYHG